MNNLAPLPWEGGRGRGEERGKRRNRGWLIQCFYFGFRSSLTQRSLHSSIEEKIYFLIKWLFLLFSILNWQIIVPIYEVVCYFKICMQCVMMRSVTGISVTSNTYFLCWEHWKAALLAIYKYTINYCKLYSPHSVIEHYNLFFLSSCAVVSINQPLAISLHFSSL